MTVARLYSRPAAPWQSSSTSERAQEWAATVHTLNAFNRSSIYFTAGRKEWGTGREATAVCVANLDINTISTLSVPSPQSNRTEIILSPRLEIGRQFGRLTNGNTNDKYQRRRRRRQLDWSLSAAPTSSHDHDTASDVTPETRARRLHAVGTV